MIIARAPLRISFSGGGTDIPAFYENYGGGAVVSTSINRYVYVTVNEKFDGKVSVRYRVHENVDRAEDIKHPLIREALLAYDIHSNIEIVVISEVPARGSGLGASSALAVALCAALERFKGNLLDYRIRENREIVAECAAKIEIQKVGSPIGKQDHAASAVGGLNLIEFSDRGTRYTQFDSAFSEEIESHSMLYYIDMEHEYNPKEGSFVQRILNDQISEIEEKKSTYALQRHNAYELWSNMKYEVIERFMDHINENWRLKKSLHGSISNDTIDSFMQKAFGAGAIAAKVCGAGGGGFVYLMVPPPMRDDVRSEMSEHSELRFEFDKLGVQILFDDTKETSRNVVHV